MFGGKILVVEDEVFIAHDIRKILQAEGYEVIIDCFNMDMAILAVSEYRPDLVLVDINLGHKKSGFDVADYLERIVRIPYVFITSYFDWATLLNVSERSPVAYLTKPFKPQDLISAVFLIMNRIKNKSTPKVEDTAIPFAITQVMAYIDKNIGNKLSLESLARLTSWEAEYFGRLFKEHTGLTPYQYILKIRIERSKEMLVRTNQPAQDISFEVGFSNYRNFFTAFRKQMLMSPERYRKLMKKV